MKRLKPVTPGELLRDEFLIPMAISQYRLAKEIGVPAQRISEIVTGKRAVTADTDLRLCRFFGLSKGYWLRAQAAYDTEICVHLRHLRISLFVTPATPSPPRTPAAPPTVTSDPLVRRTQRRLRLAIPE